MQVYTIALFMDNFAHFHYVCEAINTGLHCDANEKKKPWKGLSHLNFTFTGNCTDYTGAYRCTCDPGYSGPNCTTDIDDCESSPCIHGK